MVVYVLHDGGETDIQHGEILEGLRVPVNLDFFALGVCNNLSGNVDLVGHVENIQTDVVSDVGKVNFLVRVQTKPVESRLLGDPLGFFTGDSRDSTHDFFRVSGAVVEIETDGSVHEDLSDIFHCVRAVVCRERTRLSHGVNLSDVSKGSSWSRSDVCHSIIYFLVSDLRFLYVGNSRGA